MNARGVVLSLEMFNRFRDVLAWAEGQMRGSGVQQEMTTHPSPGPCIVRVTGPVDAGIYPGMLEYKEPSDGSWNEIEECLVCGLNDEILDEGSRYLARVAGTLDGVVLVIATVSGSSGTGRVLAQVYSAATTVGYKVKRQTVDETTGEIVDYVPDTFYDNCIPSNQIRDTSTAPVNPGKWDFEVGDYVYVSLVPGSSPIRYLIEPADYATGLNTGAVRYGRSGYVSRLPQSYEGWKHFYRVVTIGTADSDDRDDTDQGAVGSLLVGHPSLATSLPSLPYASVFAYGIICSTYAPGGVTGASTGLVSALEPVRSPFATAPFSDLAGVVVGGDYDHTTSPYIGGRLPATWPNAATAVRNDGVYVSADRLPGGDGSGAGSYTLNKWSSSRFTPTTVFSDRALPWITNGLGDNADWPVLVLGDVDHDPGQVARYAVVGIDTATGTPVNKIYVGVAAYSRRYASGLPGWSWVEEFHGGILTNVFLDPDPPAGGGPVAPPGGASLAESIPQVGIVTGVNETVVVNNPIDVIPFEDPVIRNPVTLPNTVAPASGEIVGLDGKRHQFVDGVYVGAVSTNQDSFEFSGITGGNTAIDAIIEFLTRYNDTGRVMNTVTDT